MPFPIPGRIAELVRRSTVQIRGTSARAEGSGSGIVLNRNRVITNAHVLVSGSPVIETWDGSTHDAKVIKRDQARDLAVLEAKNLNAQEATLALQTPVPGQPVIAVGNPFGFIGAVSTGNVYRVGTIRGLGFARWVQSDLRLAPGNSGGPLTTIHGEILGINTMIAGPLALAIPVDIVQLFLSSSTQKRTLGVTLRPVTVRNSRGQLRFGLVVLELEAGGNAERASLLPGDILTSAGGQKLESPDDLAIAISNGDSLKLGFLRGNHPEERRVTVQLDPQRTATAA
jgi:serine protease Do